jgi:hypothetical protein
MNSEAQNITTIDEIWAKVSDEEAKQEWEDRAVQAAVADPKIQTAAGLLPYCRGLTSPENARDRVLSREYDAVPPARRQEVFEKAAEILMRRELGLDGEA